MEIVPFDITYRPLSAAEMKSIRRIVRFTADHWAWILCPPFAFGAFGYVGGHLIEWLLGLIGIDVAPVVERTLMILGAVIGVPAAWLTWRSFCSARTAVKHELGDANVEVIRVTDVQLIQQSEYNDEGPTYYFDDKNGRILLLWGQWIFDPHVVILSNAHDLNSDETADVFPADRFTVHRLPESGMVLRIEVDGYPAKPKQTLRWNDVSLAGLRASEWLEGTVEELSELVTHRAREIVKSPRKRKRSKAGR